MSRAETKGEERRGDFWESELSSQDVCYEITAAYRATTSGVSRTRGPPADEGASVMEEEDEEAEEE